MDYSKIRLDNERNEHVTKRLNRLSTWKFFKVIYRENIWRMFGYNFLMIMCILPMLVIILLSSFRLSEIQRALPMLNGIGFSTGAWFGSTGQYATVADYLTAQTFHTQLFYFGMSAVAALVMTLMFSGGFAVIRDAFWTGKLSTVGVFRSMWKGIKANILYAFVGTAVIAGSVYGIWCFYAALKGTILWLAITGTVLLSILAFFVAMYVLILCSVTVTYKQSVYANLDDAWRLMWLNILPNIIHFVVALIPIGLYFVFGSFLQQIYMIIMLMFGGLYFPLVWQTHMMKTFALFHPVPVRKKKQAKNAAEREIKDEYVPEQETPSDAPRKAKTKKSAPKQLADSEPTTEQNADETTQDTPSETDEQSGAEPAEEAAEQPATSDDASED